MPRDHFSDQEAAALNPTVTSILNKMECLSSGQQVSVIALILTAVRRQHRLDDSFNLVEFVLGEGAQEERQVAA